MKIFICGPTLYEKCHIGHARIFIFFNFLINFHKFIGDSPIAILQLTDIDHKIYQKNNNHKTEKIANLPDKYLVYLFRDLENIQVEHNFIYSRVSDFLYLIKDDVVNILRAKRGYSYAGNVYLTFNDPPATSSLGLTSDQIRDMPIDISSGKKNQRDIMIWNSENFYDEHKRSGCDSKNSDEYLTSGIPGWHFQDHEIIKNVFNAKYDIHGGARELLYPHHEFIYELFIKNGLDGNNHLFQENIWVHVGLVNKDSEKMSNSSGNTVSISDVLKRYSPNALKIFFLSERYKNDIEFSIEGLDRAEVTDKVIAGLFLKNENNPQQHDYLEKQYLKQLLKILHNDYDTESSINLILEVIDKHHNPALIERMVKILGLKYY
ncbi:MAG: class I tRNA ligase family protein [Nitrosopumilus sp.]|nr:class I tRNA ligase family protein [Nitrosopumilus sp.]